ncbi:protein of unknown function [Methylacidimicrobium sp. AP8]|uniref:hypothetical protein n=1 Tax=Methylacidimicrobium sp. AP8 TaxID=2730359 RepID=UPI0018C06285|nr:hypothetical protein [Methylacidimicrobium sp. AP8]CAB4243667.1 protein of unknown function [Methylacidimicrobium sp. AP8]
MASLHVQLSVGHHTSMPHVPATLDPQMRSFVQRNLDPFSASLSTADLLRAAGHLLSVARSGFAWARQFFAASPFPPPEPCAAEGGKESGKSKVLSPAAREQGTDPKAKPCAGSHPESVPAAGKEPETEERVCQTREAGRKAVEEAEGGLRRARKEKLEESPAAAGDLSGGYGLHLALELSLHRNGREKEAEMGRRPSAGRRETGGPFGPGRPLSLRGSLSLHLPLRSVSAPERGGREGK